MIAMDPFANAPPPDFNHRNMDRSSLLCQLALEYALPRREEAPNYGFFSLLLQHYLSGIDYENNVATFCIPQLPLSTDISDADVTDDDDLLEGENEDRPSPTRHHVSRSFSLC
jgi:hypothetical protein